MATRFAALKMLIKFQKRFGGNDRLAAIWVGILFSGYHPGRCMKRFCFGIDAPRPLRGRPPEGGLNCGRKKDFTCVQNLTPLQGAK